ncbi:MAG: ATP-binding protein [Saprospiraceae bacterium]|nr:ATP-binding protein [Saprospiraceae bacterium]
MFYKRSILPALQAHMTKKQVTVLTGMRRTGKTTLLKYLMEQSDVPQKIFFDLERLDNRELFSEKNYETIVYALTQRGIQFSEKVLIGMDEIQLVPNLPSVIKYLYDHYDIKFILTGSSSYYLKNHFEESMAGRKKIFEVYPLRFGELLDFIGVPYPAADSTPFNRPFLNAEYQRLHPYYESFIQFGGFPEVVLSENEADKKDLIADILSSYINFDIASVMDFKKSETAYKLIKLLATRIGSKVDISKLASIAGLSRHSLENYLQLFEQSYLIQTIPVSSANPDREIVKAKKLYFLDNGIASLAAELGSGAKFENAIFNQLRHWGAVSYYSMKSGQEIDFILDRKIAVEVKETAALTDLHHTARLAQNLDIETCYVVARHPTNVFEGFYWGGGIF